jgi:hypothetical protein
MSDNHNNRNRVPSWDGQARGWRRYCKEIAWYVGGCKRNDRRYLAGRLIQQLGGSARLLAMSWQQPDFERADGVLVLLRRLAASPLVRRAIPNASAIMDQYFSFRRLPGEAIGPFLVRETLGYEEFQEALIRIIEEKTGVDPAANNFGLPPLEEEDAAHGHRSNAAPWWEGRDYNGWVPNGVPNGEPLPEEPADEPVFGEDGHVREGDEPEPRPRDQVDRSVAARSVSETPPPLTAADSLILDFLQGWRLLKGATLSKEERRDVLSSTSNKIDFVSIQEALLTLYDEQGYGHNSSAGVNKHYLVTTDDGPPAYSWGDYEQADTYGDDGWYEGYYNEWDTYGDDAWYEPSAPLPDDDPEDTANINAAEILAAEANRTLAAAQGQQRWRWWRQGAGPLLHMRWPAHAGRLPRQARSPLCQHDGRLPWLRRQLHQRLPWLRRQLHQRQGEVVRQRKVRRQRQGQGQEGHVHGQQLRLR